MAGFDWNNVQVMTEGPSLQEQQRQQAELEKARTGLAMSVNPFYSMLPEPTETGVVPTLGIVGSVLPSVFPELKPFQMLSKALKKTPAVVQTMAPSLASSSALVAAGVPLEQAALGKDVFSQETAKKELGALAENAMFDVGGNLIFHVGGKALSLGKDAYKKLTGVDVGFNPKAPEASARVAAQQFLDQYGATLTRGGLTGSSFQQGLEGLLETLPGGGVLAKRAENYQRALDKGAADIMSSLQVNPEFNALIGTNKTTNQAIGERFKQVHQLAEKELKDTVAPVYTELAEKGDGLFVDMRPLKEAARAELEAMARTKFAGANAARAGVLRQIVKQDDSIRFDDAHNLRSSWMAAARDLKEEAKPATTTEAAYNKAASGLSNLMDQAAVVTFGNTEQKALARSFGLKGGIDQPAGLRSGQYKAHNLNSLADMNLPMTAASVGNNDLLRKYFNAQKAYKSGMEALFSDTVQTALKKDPSDVGRYLFTMDNAERAEKTRIAVGKMRQYAPDKAQGMMEQLQYGFLEEMFKSKEGIQKFAKDWSEDKTFKKNINVLFPTGDTAKRLQVLAEAATFGKPQSFGPTILRSQLFRHGAATAAAGVAYLSAPDSVKEVAQDLLGTGVVLYLTPTLLSKAISNRRAMNALAGLAQAQKNPKARGAVFLKSLEVLREEGLLGSQYMEDVNNMLYGKDYANKNKQDQVFSGWDSVKVLEAP